jgi:putative hydrolase of HD superfamily
VYGKYYKINVFRDIMKEKFKDFLKIQRIYDLKNVSRMNSHNYFCSKTNRDIERKETTAEHVYSSLKLADYFLMNEEEFGNLDRLKVYDLLLYHDDCEIVAGDVPIANRENRELKEVEEVKAVKILFVEYPKNVNDKMVALDREYRELESEEARFAKAIDKFDAIIHELRYPDDWAKKGFDEEKIREWHGKYLEYSKTFNLYFEFIIEYMNENGHFDL